MHTSDNMIFNPTSCYMASILQGIFALPAFQQRYFASIVQQNAMAHVDACTVPLPADCIECQMRKIADGLLSGRYSYPAPHTSVPEGGAIAPAFQKGLKPTTFKALVGKGHVEFATMKQQDAAEFLTHLLEFLRRDTKKRGITGSYLCYACFYS
jgi:ubiquitin carboxyl-terminal hydrolase 5/13